MSPIIFVIIAAVVSLTASMPSGVGSNTLDLYSVLNQTVCPIKIVMDEDQERIPKRIKVMKCAEDPNQWCSKMHIPEHECCQHQHDTVRLQCVEVQDVVQVYYPKRDATRPYRVSVGCTCVMLEAQVARQAEPSR